MTKEMIAKWKRLSATLKTVKRQEMELRKEIAESILNGQIGTVNVNMHGFKIKAQQSTRKLVDNEALLSLWSDLSEAEKEAVKWKPEIIERNYKQLSEKDILDSVITMKVNAPTLKIEKVK